MKKCEDTEMCESFMHLHLGIDATGLPDDLEIHHIYVEDWSKGGDGAAEHGAGVHRVGARPFPRARG